MIGTRRKRYANLKLPVIKLCKPLDFAEMEAGADSSGYAPLLRTALPHGVRADRQLVFGSWPATISAAPVEPSTPTDAPGNEPPTRRIFTSTATHASGVSQNAGDTTTRRWTGRNVYVVDAFLHHWSRRVSRLHALQGNGLALTYALAVSCHFS